MYSICQVGSFCEIKELPGPLRLRYEEYIQNKYEYIQQAVIKVPEQ